MRYIAFYKPYGYVSQFSGDDNNLSSFNLPKNVYPVGRLDKDSEGLLLLSDDGKFINSVLNPESKKEKTYWAQVEKIPQDEDLKKLELGVFISDYRTLPCKAKLIDEPILPNRSRPIRYRKNIPTSWIELKIVEGKNRQVRKMTSAIGFPTLRLIRVGIGNLNLFDLKLEEGKWCDIDKKLI